MSKAYDRNAQTSPLHPEASSRAPRSFHRTELARSDYLKFIDGEVDF
jgi:hypothetical protein